MLIDLNWGKAHPLINWFFPQTSLGWYEQKWFHFCWLESLSFCCVIPSTDFWGSPVCLCRLEKHCLMYFFRSHLRMLNLCCLDVQTKDQSPWLPKPSPHSFPSGNIPLHSAHGSSLIAQAPSADKFMQIKVWVPSFPPREVQQTHPVNPSSPWTRSPREKVDQ